MRISDWSSDVCSSDLLRAGHTRASACARELSARVCVRHARMRSVLSRCRMAPIRAFSHIPEGIHARFAGARVALVRSEERRVGKECVSTCRSRWAPYHTQKKQTDGYRKYLYNI